VPKAHRADALRRELSAPFGVEVVDEKAVRATGQPVLRPSARVLAKRASLVELRVVRAAAVALARVAIEERLNVARERRDRRAHRARGEGRGARDGRRRERRRKQLPCEERAASQHAAWSNLIRSTARAPLDCFVRLLCISGRRPHRSEVAIRVAANRSRTDQPALCSLLSLRLLRTSESETCGWPPRAAPSVGRRRRPLDPLSALSTRGRSASSRVPRAVVTGRYLASPSGWAFRTAAFRLAGSMPSHRRHGQNRARASTTGLSALSLYRHRWPPFQSARASSRAGRSMTSCAV